MIISHKHRYLFVELPHTGSTAISKELRKHYDGARILGKHANYYRFLRMASDEEKQYYVFSGIRNPLDVAVTKYFKYKTNHKERYTSSIKIARNRGVGNYVDRKLFDFVQKRDADFSTFFLAFYRIPYNTWASLHHKTFDFVIRFENLVDDFAEVLHLIGFDPERPLPQKNKTVGKKRHFTAYYSPLAIERAKRVFVLYMQEWGYEFPTEWGGAASIPRWAQKEYQFYSYVMKIYWEYLKPWMWRKVI